MFHKLDHSLPAKHQIYVQKIDFYDTENKLLFAKYEKFYRVWRAQLQRILLYDCNNNTSLVTKININATNQLNSGKSWYKEVGNKSWFNKQCMAIPAVTVKPEYNRHRWEPVYSEPCFVPLYIFTKLYLHLQICFLIRTYNR